MSALQIENPSSDDANGSRYRGLAELRAAVLDDRVLRVYARTAVGILAAVALAIMVAGIATDSLLGIVGGGLSTILMGGMLVALLPLPSTLTRR